jgi:hypothetical protein
VHTYVIQRAATFELGSVGCCCPGLPGLMCRVVAGTACPGQLLGPGSDGADMAGPVPACVAGCRVFESERRLSPPGPGSVVRELGRGLGVRRSGHVLSGHKFQSHPGVPPGRLIEL